MKIKTIYRSEIIYKNGKSPLAIRFTHQRAHKLVSLGKIHSATKHLYVLPVSGGYKPTNTFHESNGPRIKNYYHISYGQSSKTI